MPSCKLWLRLKFSSAVQQLRTICFTVDSYTSHLSLFPTYETEFLGPKLLVDHHATEFRSLNTESRTRTNQTPASAGHNSSLACLRFTYWREDPTSCVFRSTCGYATWRHLVRFHKCPSRLHIRSVAYTDPTLVQLGDEEHQAALFYWIRRFHYHGACCCCCCWKNIRTSTWWWWWWWWW